jgi:ATP-dependent DNA helicase DinG
MPTGTSLFAALLAPNGPVASAMREVAGAGFEPRPQQSRMCEGVALAMQRSSTLLVEAGTGTGKSFAYLLPAALRCVLYGQNVVVSTHTISLQEQLIQKDLPVIQRVIDALVESGSLPEPATPDGKARPLKPVLVKGRGNYVSVRRLKLASERQDKLFSDPAARRSLHVIEDWAYTTRDGTVSSLPAIERWGVWDKVQSDSGNCMGKKCPNYEQCFFQSARREMEESNLFVCNHALFFSDLALRAQDAGFLPRYEHAIFDEAHTVEEVAGEHFGASLSEGRVAHLLAGLYQSRTGKGYLSQLSLISEDLRALERTIALVDRAHDASRRFFEDLARKAESASPDNPRARPWTQQGAARAEGGSEPRVLRIRSAGVVPNDLSPVMRELALRLRGLREDAKHDADRYELNAYALRAEMIAQDAGLLIEQTAPASAYWIEVTGNDSRADGAGASRRVTLACAPLEVAPILKERLFAQPLSVVLTSATLATRGQHRAAEPAPTGPDADAPAFEHTIRQLGCEHASTMLLGSPFDYPRQVEVFVERVGAARPSPPNDTRDGPPTHSTTNPPSPARYLAPADDLTWLGAVPPSPARANNPAPREARPNVPPHAQRLADAVMKHVRATDGGAFVLFTSFATLNQVARAMERECARLALPLLAQGRDGSRTAILQKFREDPRSVLLGAASFWQGVDVRGQGLRNVIITKLPFDPPDRPLVQARGELIQSRGGSPFMEDALPRAVLRFKQGFGRLIRSADDHGRVVILDERVVTTRYGRAFLDALPEGVPIRASDTDDASDSRQGDTDPADQRNPFDE